MDEMALLHWSCAVLDEGFFLTFQSRLKGNDESKVIHLVSVLIPNLRDKERQRRKWGGGEKERVSLIMFNGIVQF